MTKVQAKQAYTHFQQRKAAEEHFFVVAEKYEKWSKLACTAAAVVVVVEEVVLVHSHHYKTVQTVEVVVLGLDWGTFAEVGCTAEDQFSDLVGLVGPVGPVASEVPLSVVVAAEQDIVELAEAVAAGVEMEEVVVVEDSPRTDHFLVWEADLVDRELHLAEHVC